jgi:hypothetical protein
MAGVTLPQKRCPVDPLKEAAEGVQGPPDEKGLRK